MVGFAVALDVCRRPALGDAVFGVVELPDLPDLPDFGVVALGVALFGVAVLGVAALGVVALGIVALGVDNLGVSAFALMTSGVTTLGVNAFRGLCDLRCGLVEVDDVFTLAACSMCLLGVLRSCFSTVGEGCESCRCSSRGILVSISTRSGSCGVFDCCGELPAGITGASTEGSSG